MGVATLLLHQLAVAALLASTLFVAGKIALGKVRFRNRAEEISTASALGFGLVGTLLFGLSALQLFETTTLALLVLAVHATGWRVWRDLLRRPSGRGPAAGGPGLVLALALTGLPAFALTLYPPTAFDETLYHLPYAKAFAANHGLPFLETLRFPIGPQLVEVLYGALLLSCGEVVTHLPSALAFGLTGLALAAWIGEPDQDAASAANQAAAGAANRAAAGAAKRAAAGAANRAAAGAAAAALWLGNPLTAWLGGTAYVDLPLALFGVLAWIWWDRWRREGGSASLALAGAFAGFAAATKYNGLLIVALLSAATLAVAVRRRHGASIAKFVGVAILALSPWYARNLLQTGNPVFPLLPDLFGPNAWMTPDDLAVWQSGPRNIPASVLGYAASRVRETVLHPWQLLEWPWKVAYQPSAFGGQTPLSPFLPLVLLLAAAGGLWDRRMRPVLIFVAALFFVTTAHDPRLLLPADALLGGAAAVGLTRGLERLRMLRSRLAATLIALLLAAPGAAYAGWRVRRQGRPPVRTSEREAYLARTLPGYAQLAFYNRTRQPADTIYVLLFENLHYYAEGRLLGDWVGPYRYARVFRALGSGAALWDELERMDAGSLLVNVPRLPRPLPDDSFFRRNFRSLAGGGPVLLLERVRPPEGSGPR